RRSPWSRLPRPYIPEQCRGHQISGASRSRLDPAERRRSGVQGRLCAMTPAQTLQLASHEESKIIEGVFLKNAAAKKSVIFTSPDRRSGCSWVVTKLARSLAARVSGSVCVVDANLRWPALHDMLWLDNTRGLLQAIQEASPIRSYAQRIHDSN